jgi:hypothetical protein
MWQSDGLSHHVGCWVCLDVLEESVASILKVSEIGLGGCWRRKCDCDHSLCHLYICIPYNWHTPSFHWLQQTPEHNLVTLMVKAAGSCEAMEQTCNPTHSNNPEYYNVNNSSNESVKICVLDIKNSLCNKHCNSSITLLHGIVIMHACIQTYTHIYIHTYIQMWGHPIGILTALFRAQLGTHTST